jgi:hypothetical protein
LGTAASVRALAGDLGQERVIVIGGQFIGIRHAPDEAEPAHRLGRSDHAREIKRRIKNDMFGRDVDNIRAEFQTLDEIRLNLFLVDVVILRRLYDDVDNIECACGNRR